MTKQILTKTDYAIFSGFLGISLLISVGLWLFPFSFIRELIPAVPVVCAVAILLIIRRHDRLTDQKAQQNTYRQIEAWIAIQHFIQPNIPISGLRGGAISPDLAVVLYRELFNRKPSLVLECGAGLSTLLIGYFMRGLGKGKLITLEHDAMWVERVNSWISLHNLGNQVEIIYSPIVEHTIEGSTVQWYSIDGLQTVLEKEPDKYIDLAFVDGPPESINPNIRWPAVPILRTWFDYNCTIVVDDTNRSAERDIVHDWCRFLSATCEWIPTEKGTAIIRIKSGLSSPK